VRRPRLDLQRRSPAAVGLVALILVAVGSYWGFTKTNPFADPFEVQAAFRTAADVKPGSPVRIAGVEVGEVTKVDGIAGGRGAIVHMAIEDGGLPIKRDARFKIRPRIFLEGNYFVDVQPGSPSAPELEEGARIPVQQTAAPVGFGEVLAALQSDTREDLRKLLDEYGRALETGGGEGYNRSTPYWESAFRDSAIVNDAMRGKENGDLAGYARGAGRVSEALDRDATALKDLIADLATTSTALASEGRNLSAAVDELPRTLTVGHRALGDLRAALPRFRRLAGELRPAMRSSEPALRSGLPFIRQARALIGEDELGGLARDLRRTTPSLVELNRGGVRFQEQARLLSSCQNNVVLPTTEEKITDPNFPATGPVYREAVKWLPGIAGESRSFDSNGQYIRTFAHSANYAYPLNDGRFMFTGLPLEGVNPPKSPGQPPYRADVPCETQERPDLRTKIGQPPKAIKVDHDSPAARARYEGAKDEAVDWARDALRAAGLEGRFQVLSRDLTAAQVAKLGAATERARRTGR
jgi:phospholipid/cholesterol/gamma-HCH transport system substrate-binding protein